MYAIERPVRFASYIPYTNKSIVYVWENFILDLYLQKLADSLNYQMVS